MFTEQYLRNSYRNNMKSIVGMDNSVLETAKNIGFLSRIDRQNHWQILPSNSHETWMLTAMESRWILSIKDVPQLILSSKEAIAFQERRSLLVRH